VVAPDLLGHGLAPRSDRYQVEDLAENILPRIAGEDFELLIGHSLGGPVSLVLFPHLQIKPKRYVLVDPALEVDDMRMEMVKNINLNDVKTRPSAAQYAQQRPNWTENATIAKSLAACLASAEALEYIGTVWWPHDMLLAQSLTLPENETMVVHEEVATSK